MSSISSLLTGATHGAFSQRAATTSAATELQSLFSRLHMDALDSASASTSSATTGSNSGSGSSGDSASSSDATATNAVSALTSGLRSLFDGTLTVAKDARAVAKAYTKGGPAGLAAQVISKLG